MIEKKFTLTFTDGNPPQTPDEMVFCLAAIAEGLAKFAKRDSAETATSLMCAAMFVAVNYRGKGQRKAQIEAFKETVEPSYEFAETLLEDQKGTVQ